MTPETLKKYLSNQCTEEERRQVNEWYQQLDFPAEEPFGDSDEERLYRSIRSELGSNEPELPVRPLVSVWSYIGRIAAVFVLGFGILFYLYHKSAAVDPRPDGGWVSFTNSKHRIVPYLLPDSTTIWLHPGAQIQHAKSFRTRDVSFSGEGFFHVKPDKSRPFVIRSGDMRTKVLGTSFNVRAIPGEASFKVSVATGSVQVGDASGRRSVILKPEQQVVFEKKSKQMQVAAVRVASSDKELWQSASLVFNEVPMTEVAGRLMHTFHIRIDFADPDLARCRLKVDFTEQRLPEILDMIDTLLGSTYRLEGDRVIFSGEGCR